MSHPLESVDLLISASYANSRLASLKRWGVLLSRFLTVQLLVQAVSLGTGLLLLRKLTQQEYAFFTLANSMQATLLLLADVGLMSAMSATGGKVWQDRRRFGSLLNTGLALRKQLGLLSMVVVVPILFWMLVTRGAGALHALLLTIAVLIGVNYRFVNDVFAIVPKLHAQVNRLQRLDFQNSVVRLLIVLIGYVTYLNAALAVMATSVTYWLTANIVRRWAAEGADLTEATNEADRQTIWKVIRQQAPNTIYYCVQGQLVVFLIALFGNTKNIAEVGALGRLSVIFTLISSVMANIVLPRFARCQERKRLVRIYIFTLAGYGVLSLMLLVASILLPGPFLWLLGSKYAHLTRELPYAIGMTVAYAFGGTIYSLNAARAWTRWAWLSIPITIIGQIVLLPILNLSNVSHILIFNTAPALLGSLAYVIEAYFAISLHRVNIDYGD